MSTRFEVFVPCPDYPELFWIGNRGTLFSLRTFQDVKLTPSHNGYPMHATKIGGRKGKCICVRIHVQVAKAFVKNVEDKPFVNHKDGRKDNNSWDNLEWVTHLENMEHAVRHGLLKHHRGHDNPASVVSPEMLKDIRSKVGIVSYRKIAKEYAISKTTVRKIALGLRYQQPVVEAIAA